MHGCYACRALSYISLKPAPLAEENTVSEGATATKKKKSKRKADEASVNDGANGLSDEQSKKEMGASKLRIVPMRDPCLFVGHLGPKSLIVAEKPWAEVVSRFPPPLYRHKYGT